LSILPCFAQVSIHHVLISRTRIKSDNRLKICGCVTFGRMAQQAAGRAAILSRIRPLELLLPDVFSHAGLAALMVCGEADVACPFVKGSSLRVSMPYIDPKTHDNGAYEAAKQAERRDDIGRLMLSVPMQARGGLAAKATQHQ
jgi:hypothetical protein